MQLFFTILLWVLGILAAVLLILLICPVWVHWKLYYDKLSVKLQILGIMIPLYPQTGAKKQKKKPKPQTQPQPQKKQGPAPEKRLQMTFEKVIGIIKASGGIAKKAIAAIKIRNICVVLPIEGENAADTALLYGKVSAWFYGGLAAAQNLLDMQFESVELIPDFGGDNKYRRSFSCKTGTCPLIMLGVAIYAFRLLRKEHIF